MALYKKKNFDFEHSDNRGKLVQLVHDGYKQINVIETFKGVSRGDHYHKISHESFYVISGKVKVSLSKDEEMEEYIFEKGDFFEIEPYVMHSMSFMEDCVMVSMYDIPVEKEDGTKDIYGGLK